MFGFAAEKKEIAKVKARIAQEREQLADETMKLMPIVGKGAIIGSVFMSVKKFAPMLRPVVIGMVQRSLVKHGKRGILKAVGLIGAGVVAWRLLGSGDDAEDVD